MDLTSQMPIATKSSKFEISKESLTASLAKKFSKIFKKGDIIFLYGEIGVGKTTFVKYLINSLSQLFEEDKNFEEIYIPDGMNFNCCSQ